MRMNKAETSPTPQTGLSSGRVLACTGRLPKVNAHKPTAACSLRMQHPALLPTAATPSWSMGSLSSSHHPGVTLTMSHHGSGLPRVAEKSRQAFQQVKRKWTSSEQGAQLNLGVRTQAASATVPRKSPETPAPETQHLLLPSGSMRRAWALAPRATTGPQDRVLSLGSSLHGPPHQHWPLCQYDAQPLILCGMMCCEY